MTFTYIASGIHRLLTSLSACSCLYSHRCNPWHVHSLTRIPSESRWCSPLLQSCLLNCALPLGQARVHDLLCPCCVREFPHVCMRLCDFVPRGRRTSLLAPPPAPQKASCRKYCVRAGHVKEQKRVEAGRRSCVPIFIMNSQPIIGHGRPRRAEDMSKIYMYRRR